jgi:hypothetical protein
LVKENLLTDLILGRRDVKTLIGDFYVIAILIVGSQTKKTALQIRRPCPVQVGDKLTVLLAAEIAFYFVVAIVSPGLDAGFLRLREDDGLYVRLAHRSRTRLME